MNPTKSTSFDPNGSESPSASSRVSIGQRLGGLEKSTRETIQLIEACVGNLIVKRRCQVWLLLAVLLLLGWKVIFNRLGYFGDYLYFDEIKYATVIDTLHASKQWTKLELSGQPYFGKPPLYFWLSNLTYNCFEDGPYRYRFWSAVFGLGVVLLTFGVGARLFRPLTGFLGGMVLLGTGPFLFYHGARWGTFDTALTFFIFGAFAAYATLRERFWLRWILVGVALGAANLLKVLIGIPALALLLVHALVFDKPEKSADAKKRWIGLGVSLGISLLLSLPWYVSQWVLYGTPYLAEAFRHNIFGQWTGLSHFFHREGFFYYWASVSGIVPAFFLLWPAVAWVGWKAWQGSKTDSRSPRWILSWLLVTGLGWIFLSSLSLGKLLWYIYPALPALALTVALFLEAIIDYVAGVLVVPVSAMYWRVIAVTGLLIVFTYQPFWQSHWRANTFAPANLIYKHAALIKSNDFRLVTAVTDAERNSLDTEGFYLRHLLDQLPSVPASAATFTDHRPTVVVAGSGTDLKSIFLSEDFLNRVHVPTFSSGQGIIAFLVDADSYYNPSLTSKPTSASVQFVDPLPNNDGRAFKDQFTLRVDLPKGIKTTSKVQLRLTLRLQSAAVRAEPVVMQISNIDYGTDLLQRDAINQTLLYQIPPHLMARGNVTVSFLLRSEGNPSEGQTPFAGEVLDAQAMFSPGE